MSMNNTRSYERLARNKSSISMRFFQTKKFPSRNTPTEDIRHLSRLSLRSKTDFLNLINYYHDQSENEYQNADFLVRTQEDVEKWMQLWNDNYDLKSISEANLHFREWKTEKNLPTFEEFEDLLYLDEEDWLETYFLQRYTSKSKFHLEFVLNEMTVQELFETHVKYPSIRIEQIVQLKQRFNE
jgi:hypothetical protein